MSATSIQMEPIVSSVSGSNRTVRQTLRIGWSILCIGGGAYLIDNAAATYKALFSIAMPLAFIVVLGVLYGGHLLIDVLTTTKTATALSSPGDLYTNPSNDFIELKLPNDLRHTASRHTDLSLVKMTRIMVPLVLKNSISTDYSRQNGIVSAAHTM